MALSESFDIEEMHPIDLVESIALLHDWDFDRVDDDQITMAVEGRWRTYAVTLAWSGYDEVLRLVCTYELDPPEERAGAMFEALNGINDKCWTGAFTWWREKKMMVFRYGLILSGAGYAGPEQVNAAIEAAVETCEQYYPTLQLVSWTDRSPAEALKAAIGGTFGHA